MSGSKESLESLKKSKFFNPENNVKKGYYVPESELFERSGYGSEYYKYFTDTSGKFDRTKIRIYKRLLENEAIRLQQIMKFKNYYYQYNLNRDENKLEIFVLSMGGVVLGITLVGLFSGIGTPVAGVLLALVSGYLMLGVGAFGILGIFINNMIDKIRLTNKQNELKECLSVIEAKEKELLTQDISKELKEMKDESLFHYLADTCYDIEATYDPQQTINILQNSSIIAGNLYTRHESRKSYYSLQRGFKRHDIVYVDHGPAEGVIRWQGEICTKILQSEMTIEQMLKCLGDLKINKEFVESYGHIIDEESQDAIKKLLSLKEANEIINDFLEYSNVLKKYVKDPTIYTNDFEQINHIPALKDYINDRNTLSNAEYESKLSELQEKKSLLANDYKNLVSNFDNIQLKKWFKENEEFAASFLKNTPMKNIDLKEIRDKLEKQIDDFKKLHENEENMSVEATTSKERPIVNMITKKENLLTRYKEHMEYINVLNNEPKTTPANKPQN